MDKAQEFYPDCPEVFLVSMARTGDREAFAEIVRRRQSALRNLMRRLSGDDTLADDLAQQVFLKTWLNIRSLRKAGAFGAWLKRLAVTAWLQHLRRKDALRNAGELTQAQLARRENPAIGQDLDIALATLSGKERLCIVLAYQEGMSHREISDAAGLPLGTVKSHINRGSEKLRQALADYDTNPGLEESE
ncbi:MAG: sigma-70 family RNA polymerase sigma factor [Xanthomonadales bacterium]|nr:sigma-70 family RNA polymerase sigma factor [Xanthomonadales bacterium]NIX13339.1 sigma-70 family RNA polymerase sigma factor [Xanthomonadales bacterium]